MPQITAPAIPVSYATPAVVKRKPALDFSITGLVYCAMMIFMGLAAINSQANLLFGVFGLMIGILLISGVVSRHVLRRLRVRRVLPDHAIVGRPITVLYQITNEKSFWPSLSVTVAELDGSDGFTTQPHSYMLHAAPGTTASVPTEIVPMRRGLHQFDRYQVSTSFPFGFIKRAVNARHRDHLLVYPPLAQVDAGVLQLCQAAENSGATMRPRRGGQDEFYGVKEYRPGDNPRRIYWRRSARAGATGTLVTREMTQVAPPRLLLIVDTYAGAVAEPYPTTPPSPMDALVEKTIAMAGSLAARALDEDLSVGLLAWNGGAAGSGYVAAPPSRGKRHRNDLLSVLARLPVNRTHGAQALLAQAGRMIKSGTTAVLLTPTGAGDARCGETARGSMMVLCAASASADAWFQFDEPIARTFRKLQTRG